MIHNKAIGKQVDFSVEGKIALRKAYDKLVESNQVATQHGLVSDLAIENRQLACILRGILSAYRIPTL